MLIEAGSSPASGGITKNTPAKVAIAAALFRNTAAGIATFAGVFFVIPPLAGLLPASFSNHLTPYLPSNAGVALWGGASNLQHALSPWTGFALLCGYAVVLIGAAAWRLRRADA